MASRTTQALTTAASGYLRFLATLLVTFLLTPLLVRHLGAESFGLWSLVFATLGFFNLLDLGFGPGVVRYVAACRGDGDIEKRNRMVSTLGAVYCLLALVATLLLLILTPFYGHLLSIPSERQQTAIALLWILGLRSTVLALPLGLFQGILFGDRHSALVNALQGIGSVVYGVLAAVALMNGAGVVTLAWVNLGAMLLEYVAYVVLAFLLVPDLRLTPSRIDMSLLREAAGFSIAQFIVSIAALVRLRTDPLIIAFFLPLEQVAIYTVALRVAESSLLLIKQGANALTPTIAAMYAAKETEGIRRALLRASRYTFAGACFIVAAPAFFASDLLTLWVGEKFATGAPTLIALLASVALVTPQLIAANVLALTGSHKITARAEVIGTLLNFGLSIALVRPLGLVGVALGTLMATLIVDLLVIVRSACKVYSISAGDYLGRVVLPGLAPGLAVIVGAALARAVLIPGSLMELAIAGIFSLIPGVVVFLAVSLEPNDRTKILSRFKPPVAVTEASPTPKP